MDSETGAYTLVGKTCKPCGVLNCERCVAGKPGICGVCQDGYFVADGGRRCRKVRSSKAALASSAAVDQASGSGQLGHATCCSAPQQWIRPAAALLSSCPRGMPTHVPCLLPAPHHPWLPVFPLRSAVPAAQCAPTRRRAASAPHCPWSAESVCGVKTLAATTAPAMQPCAANVLKPALFQTRAPSAAGSKRTSPCQLQATARAAGTFGWLHLCLLVAAGGVWRSVSICCAKVHVAGTSSFSRLGCSPAAQPLLPHLLPPPAGACEGRPGAQYHRHKQQQQQPSQQQQEQPAARRGHSRPSLAASRRRRAGSPGSRS